MTKIEWTERSWNPIVGCSVLSPGCTNCYAMIMAARIERMGTAPHYAGTTQTSRAGPVWTGKLAMAPDKTLTAPLRRRKPTTYFVNSMGDLFHENVPDAWIHRVWRIMAQAETHTFQVLTKRADRMRDYLARYQPVIEPTSRVLAGPNRWERGVASGPPKPDYITWNGAQPRDRAEGSSLFNPNRWPLPNVWLGVSAEDQTRADERIPDLLETPAAVRFVSAEPLLKPVDLTRWLRIRWQCSSCRGYYAGRHNKTCPDCGAIGGWTGSHAFNGRGMPDHPVIPPQSGRGIDWVIVGGESGPNARPMHPDWARSLRDQCQAADVPFFFKQWGEYLPIATAGEGARDATQSISNHHVFPDTKVSRRIGKRAAGRLLDGYEWSEMPL